MGGGPLLPKKAPRDIMNPPCPCWGVDGPTSTSGTGTGAYGLLLGGESHVSLGACVDLSSG